MSDKLLVEVNGVVYEQFIEGSVSMTIAGASSFSFSASANDVTIFPFSLGDSVRCLVDNTVILTGYLNDINVASNDRDHTISISGRDKVGDLIDSTAVGNIEFNTPITLKQVCENVIANLGLDIDVIDEVSDIKPFASDEVISGNPDVKAIQLLDKYARKRQVLLRSTTDGNLLITRAGNQFITSFLLNEKNGTKNNIKNSSVRYNDTERFNKINVISQSASAKSTYSVKDSVGHIGTATDSGVRGSRQLTMISETPADNLTCTQRAKWEVNIRKSKSFQYNCTVQDYFGINQSNDKLLWLPNRRVYVKDDFANINSELLIKETVFIKSLQSGSESQISLVRPESYTLQTKDRFLSSNKIGENLT